MNKPKVTVVTITYNLLNANREYTFRQCMSSVYNQTYENIEHIIIDGASNDGTLEILKEFENNKQCIVYSEKDDGIYDAMNKGISKATGEYIIFLNSDDYFNNMNAIKQLTEALVTSNNDFACGSVMTQNVITLIPFYPQLNLFFQTMPFSHQSLLCKTSVLKELGGFDTRFKLGADLDLIIRLILNGYKPSVVQDYVAFYRCDGLSGLNYEKVIEDYANIFIKNYKCFYDLTFDEAKKLAKFKKVSEEFGRSLDKYLKHCNPYFYQQFVEGNYLDEHIIKGGKKPSRQIIKLFKKFPLLKIKEDFVNYKIYLFGILPIFRIKNTSTVLKIYLLLIPIIKIKKILKETI